MPRPATSEKPLLTPRQLEVLELMARGLTNREIARVLGISPGTAKVHVSAVIQALDVTNRTEAAVALRELELAPAAAGGRAGEPGGAAVPGFGDRPAIAVLPFDDLGGETDGDAFVDGLVEDLITRLAAWRWFPVIARNSTFAYKGQRVDVAAVSRDLGARYVVEGSARRSGDRVRINVQLIDGATGHHVHAEIFDRPAEDVLTVQDEIVEMLVAALAPALSQLEGLRALRKPTADLSAWEAFQRGMTFLNRQAPSDVEHAEDAFAHALAADPFFAPAHAGLAMARIGRGVYAVGLMQLAPAAPEERKAAEVRAIELLASAQEPAREAIRLDPLDFSGHLALGGLQGFFRQASQAIDSLTRAAELNPSSAMACWGLGGALLAPEADALGEGIALLERAVRLSPRDPLVHHFLGVLAGGYGLAGRFEDMLSAAQRSVDRQPERGLSYVPYLVTALVRVGRLDEARALAAQLRAENPDWNLDLARLLAHPDLVALIADGLAEAGWVIEGP